MKIIQTLLVGASLLAFASSAMAGTRVVDKQSVSFEACLETIRQVSTSLGVAPVNIVETSILRVVRFNTDDGSGKSILVTCSKPDQKMLINESW